MVQTTVDNTVLRVEISNAYNLSKLSLNQSLASPNSNLRSLEWKPDGTKLYEVTWYDGQIHGYDVSTPWDVSTATLNQSISTQDDSPEGIEWSSNGSKLYEVGSTSNLIYEYSALTAWDISTASFNRSINTRDDDTKAIVWKRDGTKLYELGYSSNQIYEHDVSASTTSVPAGETWRVHINGAADTSINGIAVGKTTGSILVEGDTIESTSAFISGYKL